MNEKIVKKRKKISKSAMQDYSLAFIPLLYVFIFSYLPMVGIMIAFKDYRYDKGIFGSEWVGFRNFEFFFIVAGIAAALFVAIMLYSVVSRASTKVFQTVLITPHFLSWVVVGYMVYGFLNTKYGLLNILLSNLGFDKVDWYSTPGAWPAILTIASIWKHVGMDSVTYYAALMGIDSSYIEAATVDGASKWQIRWHIIIPSIVPVITILTILKIGGIFRADFGLFYQLPRNIGTLYATTDVMDTYIFRTMRVVGDMGMSSAAGLLQSVVGFIMVILTNKLSKKIDKDNGLF